MGWAFFPWYNSFQTLMKLQRLKAGLKTVPTSSLKLKDALRVLWNFHNTPFCLFSKLWLVQTFCITRFPSSSLLYILNQQATGPESCIDSLCATFESNTWLEARYCRHWPCGYWGCIYFCSFPIFILTWQSPFPREKGRAIEEELKSKVPLFCGSNLFLWWADIYISITYLADAGPPAFKMQDTLLLILHVFINISLV